MTLLFDAEKHKYFIKEKPDFKLVSVSHIISLLKPKFDPDGSIIKKYSEKGKDAILKDLAKKWELTPQQAKEKWGHLEFTVEDIQKIWDEKKDNSLIKGTKVHALKEEGLLKKGSYPSLYEEGYKKAYDLSTLKEGVYPELMLWILSAGITGTADKVEIFSDRSFKIGDFKTNSAIEFQGFKAFDPKTKERKAKRMNVPVQHLEDCSGMHYTIQLSLYAYMLEQFGFTCKELELIHLITDSEGNIENEIIYPIEYKKREVINIINWYKSKK